jgi:hypothetical protein
MSIKRRARARWNYRSEYRKMLELNKISGERHYKVIDDNREGCMQKRFMKSTLAQLIFHWSIGTQSLPGLFQTPVVPVPLSAQRCSPEICVACYCC